MVLRLIRRGIRPPFLITITDIDNLPYLCQAHFDLWYLIITDGQEFKINPQEFLKTGWMTLNQARRLITDPNNLLALKRLEQTISKSQSP